MAEQTFSGDVVDDPAAKKKKRKKKVTKVNFPEEKTAKEDKEFMEDEPFLIGADRNQSRAEIYAKSAIWPKLTQKARARASHIEAFHMVKPHRAGLVASFRLLTFTDAEDNVQTILYDWHNKSLKDLAQIFGSGLTCFRVYDRANQLLNSIEMQLRGTAVRNFLDLAGSEGSTGQTGFGGPEMVAQPSVKTVAKSSKSKIDPRRAIAPAPPKTSQDFEGEEEEMDDPDEVQASGPQSAVVSKQPLDRTEQEDPTDAVDDGSEEEEDEASAPEIPLSQMRSMPSAFGPIPMVQLPVGTDAQAMYIGQQLIMHEQRESHAAERDRETLSRAREMGNMKDMQQGVVAMALDFAERMTKNQTVLIDTVSAANSRSDAFVLNIAQNLISTLASQVSMSADRAGKDDRKSDKLMMRFMESLFAQRSSDHENDRKKVLELEANLEKTKTELQARTSKDEQANWMTVLAKAPDIAKMVPDVAKGLRTLITGNDMTEDEQVKIAALKRYDEEVKRAKEQKEQAERQAQLAAEEERLAVSKRRQLEAQFEAEMALKHKMQQELQAKNAQEALPPVAQSTPPATAAPVPVPAQAPSATGLASTVMPVVLAPVVHAIQVRPVSNHPSGFSTQSGLPMGPPIVTQPGVVNEWKPTAAKKPVPEESSPN